MTKDVEKKKLPMLDIKASLVPKSFKKEDGFATVECVLTTDMACDRYNWDHGRYKEVLSMDPGHIRADRMNTGGAPVLNNHGTAFFGGVKDLSDVIGVISKFWIEDNKPKAILRFADTSDVEIILRKIETGILKNISIGYRVYKYQDETPKDVVEPKMLRAVDWEIFEASVVAIPADYNAMIKQKSEGAELNEVEIVKKKSIEEKPIEEISAPAAPEKEEETQNMDPVNEPAQDSAPASDAPNVDEVKKQGAEGERFRILEITKAAKTAKMSDEFLSSLISKNVSVDDARKAIFDEMAKGQVDVKSHNPSITITRDERDTFRKAGVEAILHRAAPHKHQVTELGRRFAGFTLKEMARKSLELQGISTDGMNAMDLVGRSLHTTSDFPYILADAINKSLRSAYDESPKTFTAWAKRASASDFKNINRTQLNNFPSLTKVLEHGEIQSKTVSEDKETYSLASYAGIVGISRQAIINDDLNAFDRLAAGAGIAAAALESDIVYAILTANAALNDTVALFHASHSNLGSGAISVASLGAGRAAMRKQKAGGRVLNLRPAFLIVPAALETIAQQYVNQGIVADAPGNTNPFQNSMGLVVEPRLDDASALVWYLAAQPSLIDTVEYCYLDGAEGVYTETQMGFEVDGIKVKARHDFAAKAIDYRGLFKSTGA